MSALRALINNPFLKSFNTTFIRNEKAVKILIINQYLKSTS